MLSQRRREPDPAPDPLLQFLQEVARLPVIRSKRQYLPLVRQIRCGVLLRRLGGRADASVLPRLQQQLAKLHAALDAAALASGRPALDLAALLLEIDEFFTNSRITASPALIAVIGPSQSDSTAYLRLNGLAWRFFHLLALLPPEARLTYSLCSPTPALLAHLAHIEEKAAAARRQLVEGFLRVPLRIARKFIGYDVDYLDLVQEGVLGLITAAETYIEHGPLQFRYVAARCVTRRINAFVMNNTSYFRLSKQVRPDTVYIARRFAALADTLGYEPSDREFVVSQGWMTLDQFDAMDLARRRALVERKLARFTDLILYVRRPHDVPGVYNRETASKLARARTSLAKSLRRTPTFAEIRAAVGWWSKAERLALAAPFSAETARIAQDASRAWRPFAVRLRTYRRIHAQPFSWEQLASLTTREPPWPRLSDLLPADEDLDRRLALLLLAPVLQSVIQRLHRRDQAALISLHGLFGQAAMTSDEYGATLGGLSGERVRQYGLAALKNLQQPHHYAPLLGFVEEVSLTDLYATLHRARFFRALDAWERQARVARARAAEQETARIDRLLAQYAPRIPGGASPAPASSSPAPHLLRQVTTTNVPPKV